MSDKLSSTGQLSNEAVIEDLTRDLESSLRTDNNVDEFVISPDSSAENLPTSSGDAPLGPQASDMPQENNITEFDVSQADNDTTEESDDDVNEESLKNTELTLTDDQKAERKIIAEELKQAGNLAFKDGEFERSIEKYTDGLNACPLQFQTLRAILYCNRSASKTKLERYTSAVKDCNKAIELDDKYVKAYGRRAVCYDKLNKLEESLEDYKKIVELNPTDLQARENITTLTKRIEEKNEKLKTEMLGKLKELGNMVLKPFGLSTNNFKLEQDPESKGYKINFQQ